MKNFTLYLILLTVLISCNKSDDTTPIPENLNGKWELQSAVCFCFFPDDYDFSGHTVDFNNSQGKLVIENSGDTFFVTAAGMYDFEIQDDKVIINDTIEFIFELKGQTLSLSLVDDPELADDEITLNYIKVE